MERMLKLIIDSREQKPLDFRKDAFHLIERKGLKFGDYSATFHNAVIPIVFERKGLGDLFGTMTNGYSRFKKEMARAKEAKSQLVLLIEGSIRTIAKGYEHSDFDGASMLKKLAMLKVRYDLEWYCFNDRHEMARYIEEIYQAVVRNYGAKDKVKSGVPSMSVVGGSEVVALPHPAPSKGCY